MKIRFYIDPESEQPHFYEHGVTEEEVRQVMITRGDVIWGRDNSRIKFGRTLDGRYLKVIYKPDEEEDSLFVITAYEMKGKARKAFRRRKRRRS